MSAPAAPSLAPRTGNSRSSAPGADSTAGLAGSDIGFLSARSPSPLRRGGPPLVGRFLRASPPPRAHPSPVAPALDEPQLLAASAVDRGRGGDQPAVTDGAQEVGVVGHADHRAAITQPERRAD